MNLQSIQMAIMYRTGIQPIWDLEDGLAARPDTIQPAADSPVRFEIVAEVMRQGHPAPRSLRALPHMMASMAGIRKSLKSVKQNPTQPATRISEADLGDLEAFARLAGADDVGYARASREMVFQNKAILHENAILLTMEMDKERIDSSPSEDSFVEVHQTYHHLGDAANRIAGWLRKRGYSAQAGHALNGQALYPPLAQQAGLGWRGLHGLLITPKFGPRVRLAAVFTSIENLPFGAENPHGWIETYCDLCKLCARECPTEAILDEPVQHDNGLVTCTIDEKCFPYFAVNYGCSICIRVCPFNNQDYAALQKHVTQDAGT